MFEMNIVHKKSLIDHEFLNNRVYLWIWYADKIPPHIGCSINNAYFSLKVSGKDFALPPNRVITLIEQKEIPFLLIETGSEFQLSDVNAVFSRHSLSKDESETCLTPLLDLFGFPNEVNQLHDLLGYLSKKERINHIFGLNLSKAYSALPEYGQKEIKDRLRKLKDA